MNLPIRTRLTAWYVAVLAAIILALGVFLVLQALRWIVPRDNPSEPEA